MISDDPLEDYRISVHWEGRPEDSVTNAARVVRMLENLGRCRPALDRWTEGGWTRREASIPFSTLPPQLEPMIRRLEIARFRDREGRPTQSPSYFLDVRSAALDMPASLSAVIGCPPSIADDLMNHVQIQLPGKPEPDLLKAALLALVDAWEPATGRIDPPGLDERLSRSDGRPSRPRFTAGWITYLAPPLARLVKPPAASLVESMPGGGLLLIVSKRPFGMDDADDLAACDAIQATLAPLDGIAWPPGNYLRGDPRPIEPEPAS